MDITAAYRAEVRRQRALRGDATPAAEILPRHRERSSLAADAVAMLKGIRKMAAFLHSSRAAYLLDGGLHGMTDADRDEADGEAENFLTLCKLQLRQRSAAVQAGGGDGGGGGGGRGGSAHRHQLAVLRALEEELHAVEAAVDERRRFRLQRAAESRERRLGAAAAASAAPGSASPEPAARHGGGHAAASGAEGAWLSDDGADALSDESLDEQDRPNDAHRPPTALPRRLLSRARRRAAFSARARRARRSEHSSRWRTARCRR